MEPLELFSPRKILTVSQLVSQLKKEVEASFDFVWVHGEISGLRRPGSGHLYFSLKDGDAAIRAVMFRRQAALLRFQLEEGQEVLLQGRVSVYQARGDLQIIAETAEPRGAGALALAFEQLRRRLDAEGLFDPAGKKPLPDLPGRIAVVTSPSGAAIRDFLQVLHRRHDRIAVAVYPVAVQGGEAPGQMTQALADLARWGWPQVIVLTRGGGSPEDLACFNDEGLARAIHACPIPVVSAVGHEIDVTISDLAADLRVPTPSAAAELLAAPRLELLRRLSAVAARLGGAGKRLVAGRRADLTRLARGLVDPRRRLADKRLHVDDLAYRAGHAARAALARGENRLARLNQGLAANRPDRLVARAQGRAQALAWRLERSGAAAIAEPRARLERARGRLMALSPLAVLGRGYALALGPEGGLLKDSGHVSKGDLIKVRLANGGLTARVEEVD